MSKLADRHAGELDGALKPLGDRAVSVAVEIEPDTASRPSVQHTSSMLINLLCRLSGVTKEILLISEDAALGPMVVPLAPGASTLTEALLESAEAIGGVPARIGSASAAEITLRVGPGPAVDNWRVYGEGFCGAISRGAIASARESPLPFGPYVAACLAAGEVFRAVRLPEALYRPTECVSYSAWDCTTGEGDELHEIGEDPSDLDIEFGLAGVGAVGCAVLQALWACPKLVGRAIIADSDTEGIEDTNLNRCVLFAERHLGDPKASTAASVCAESRIRWTPIDEHYELRRLPWRPELLVSAVDTNRSRDQLQQGFWPPRLLAASTKDLRAEILRCGPPGEGPCLRCFNPPEADLPDGLVREELRALSPLELQAVAREIDHPVDLVRRWAEEGGCSEAGDAALAHVRAQSEQPTFFSVGFVSVLAGTLLAAEIVKEHGGRRSVLDDHRQSAKFQFMRLTAETNGRVVAVSRDPACPACAPGQPGVSIWANRAENWPRPLDVI